jgi:hypothetical protein
VVDHTGHAAYRLRLFRQAAADLFWLHPDEERLNRLAQTPEAVAVGALHDRMPVIRLRAASGFPTELSGGPSWRDLLKRCAQEREFAAQAASPTSTES